jgi:hypothetical protein
MEALGHMRQEHKGPSDDEQHSPARKHQHQADGAGEHKSPRSSPASPQYSPDTAHDGACERASPLGMEQRVEDVSAGQSNKSYAGGRRDDAGCR